MFEGGSLELCFLAPLGFMARLNTRRLPVVFVYNNWFNTAQVLLKVLVAICVVGLDLRQ
jgi:hypothetical protein